MGNVHSQPLAGLVELMQAHFSIQTFVETGTFMGDATGFAARLFPKVISIEVNPDFHRSAGLVLAGWPRGRRVLRPSRRLPAAG
jgi:hypothetical protein